MEARPLDDPSLRSALENLDAALAALETRLSRPPAPRALATGPIKTQRSGGRAITGSLKPMPPLPNTAVSLDAAEGGFLDAFSRHEADYAEDTP